MIYKKEKGRKEGTLEHKRLAIPWNQIHKQVWGNQTHDNAHFEDLIS